MEILRKRTPLSEIIEDPDTPEQLKSRLEMIQSARLFAIDELLLPDNFSYQTFTDLERDFVVWNIVAAPEFSLQPKTWCYPIVGCVAYRGYFAEEKARAFGNKLRDDGYDVFVGGVRKRRRYIGGRQCRDPGFMVRSDEPIFFAPLISPYDGH